MSHRLFVAIELDKGAVKGLERFCDRLQTEYELDDRAIKWVKASSMHLTLKFLGDVDDREIPSVCNTLNQVVSQFDPFEFEIANCGCFPPKGAARIVWVGINKGQEDLKALAEAIDMACNEIGFTLENKPYRAHLTLARIKQAKLGFEAREAIEKVEPFSLANQSVGQVVLIDSTRSRNGPEYTSMHHATLGGS